MEHSSAPLASPVTKVHAPSLSVIIVNKGRVYCLMACLRALMQQRYSNYELIVVGDSSSEKMLNALNIFTKVKWVSYDGINVSLARNLGIAQASGEWVVFIDSDAYAELNWLSALADSINSNVQPTIISGLVYHSQGGKIVNMGCYFGKDMAVKNIEVKAISANEIAARQGIEMDVCNKSLRHYLPASQTMAFQRQALAEINGFDTRFYFDYAVADAVARLHRAFNAQLRRLKAVLVPMAVVHHTFHENEYRDGKGGVKTLHELACGAELYMTAHCPETAKESLWHAIEDLQLQKLRLLIAKRRLKPRDLKAVFRSLYIGRNEAERRMPAAEAPDLKVAKVHPQLLSFDKPPPSKHSTFCGWLWQKSSLFTAAKTVVDSGNTASVLVISPTCFAHKTTFHHLGFRLQQGGLWGRSAALGSRVNFIGFRERKNIEQAFENQYN